MVIEARDIDAESKVEFGFGASKHPPRPHCGRTNHSPERCWIKHPHKIPKNKTGKFPKKKGYKKDSDKSEGAGQQSIKSTVSWLEVDRKNGSLTQEHPLI